MYALFKYPGMKMRLSRKYVKHFPPAFDRFVSVFGGSATEFAALPASNVRKEIWNDNDPDIFNFFRVLQCDEQRAALVRRMTITVDGRKQFGRCRELLKEPTTDPVTRAWALFVIRNVGHMSSSGGWLTARGGHGRDLVKATRLVNRWAERLKNVKFECEDFGKIIARHKRQVATFTYLDPPYHLGTRSKELYDNELTHKNHVRLLAAIQGIQGTAMICGKDHWLYAECLWHWRRLFFPATNRMNKEYDEVIWMNYEDDGNRPDKYTIAKRYIEAVGGFERAQRYLNEFNRTEAQRGREENEDNN
jgi:site-specific DNA-adenine methylase